MAWHRVADLDGGGSLWTRGGLEGVYVKGRDGWNYHLPREVLEMMVSEEIKVARISQIENMTTEETIRKMKEGY